MKTTHHHNIATLPTEICSLPLALFCESVKGLVHSNYRCLPGLMHGIASFTNFMNCWIIALLCAFSSGRGKSDIAAVGERAVVCKEAE